MCCHNFFYSLLSATWLLGHMPIITPPKVTCPQALRWWTWLNPRWLWWTRNTAREKPPKKTGLLKQYCSTPSLIHLPLLWRAPPWKQNFSQPITFLFLSCHVVCLYWSRHEKPICFDIQWLNFYSLVFPSYHWNVLQAWHPLSDVNFCVPILPLLPTHEFLLATI